VGIAELAQLRLLLRELALSVRVFRSGLGVLGAQAGKFPVHPSQFPLHRGVPFLSFFPFRLPFGQLLLRLYFETIEFVPGFFAQLV